MLRIKLRFPVNGHTLPSLTYVNNVGADATTVFDAAISGSSPGCSAPGPCPFDLVIPLTTPFSFDPSKGRLLVDVVSSAPTGPVKGKLDALSFPDSTTSTVATVAGDPAQAVGTLLIGGAVLGLDSSAVSNYYFPQIAFGGGWLTTVTYVNYSPEEVNCQTTFYADSGDPLAVPFGGTPSSSRTDNPSPGADLHQQTTAGQDTAVQQGWAVAGCNSPIKASMLYSFL
jgi:hypothetical protein